MWTFPVTIPYKCPERGSFGKKKKKKQNSLQELSYVCDKAGKIKGHNIAYCYLKVKYV